MTRILDQQLPTPVDLNDQTPLKYLLGVATLGGPAAYYYCDSFEVLPGPPAILYAYHGEEKIIAVPADAGWKVVSNSLVKLISRRELAEMQCELEEGFKEVHSKTHKEEAKEPIEVFPDGRGTYL